MSEKNVILQVEGLKQYFPVKKGLFEEQRYVKAVNDVSFELYEGETLGVAGESGCGKSTLIRSCLNLIRPTEGSVKYRGQELTAMSKAELRNCRKDMQIVFQDPYSSLDDKYRVKTLIEEPMVVNKLYKTGAERQARVEELLEAVGLHADSGEKFPHEFSGGQRQRIIIASALATNPKLLMCDEPVSALDVSVRAQILNLLEKLQKEFKLTYLFVSHDMSVIEHIADRVMIMYLGKVMEIGPKREIFDKPAHPYTQALLSAVPRADEEGGGKDRIILEGDIPSPVNPPSGCVFHTRCPYATERCWKEAPARKDLGNGHLVSCHLEE